ncbi:unnamed protein product [Owenia fusiformis]|uniref:Uncharacterized protein n=1 Tax=Owenia fusiformis TaxID=6347 RepID=A0A8J1XLX3_OWEFU|nr:unnamed protein product [Owenia fusiformis]
MDTQVDLGMIHAGEKRPMDYGNLSPTESGEGYGVSNSRKVEKKRSRNESEKLRRDKLNMYIGELAKMVPLVMTAQKKMDKSSILRLTVNYLKVHRELKGNKKDIDWKPPIISNDNLSELLLQSLNGFLLVTSRKGMVIYASEELTTSLGHNLADTVGNSVKKFVHQDDQKYFLKQLELPRDKYAINHESNRHRSFYCRMLNVVNRQQLGHYEPMHVVGHIRMMTSFDTDEAADMMDSCLIAVVRKVHKESIREISILEMSKNEWITQHNLEGKIFFSDHRTSPLTGYLPYESNGMLAYQFLKPEDVKWVIKRHHHLITTGETPFCYFRMYRKDRSFIWMQSNSHIVTDVWTGKPKFILSINVVLSDEDGVRNYEEQKREILALEEAAANLALENKQEAGPIADDGLNIKDQLDMNPGSVASSVESSLKYERDPFAMDEDNEPAFTADTRYMSPDDFLKSLSNMGPSFSSLSSMISGGNSNAASLSQSGSPMSPSPSSFAASVRSAPSMSVDSRASDSVFHTPEGSPSCSMSSPKHSTLSPSTNTPSLSDIHPHQTILPKTDGVSTKKNGAIPKTDSTLLVKLLSRPSVDSVSSNISDESILKGLEKTEITDKSMTVVGDEGMPPQPKRGKRPNYPTPETVTPGNSIPGNSLLVQSLLANNKQTQDSAVGSSTSTTVTTHKPPQHPTEPIIQTSHDSPRGNNTPKIDLEKRSAYIKFKMAQQLSSQHRTLKQSLEQQTEELQMLEQQMNSGVKEPEVMLQFEKLQQLEAQRNENEQALQQLKVEYVHQMKQLKVKQGLLPQNTDSGVNQLSSLPTQHNEPHTSSTNCTNIKPRRVLTPQRHFIPQHNTQTVENNSYSPRSASMKTIVTNTDSMTLTTKVALTPADTEMGESTHNDNSIVNNTPKVIKLYNGDLSSQNSNISARIHSDHVQSGNHIGNAPPGNHIVNNSPNHGGDISSMDHHGNIPFTAKHNTPVNTNTRLEGLTNGQHTFPNITKETFLRKLLEQNNKNDTVNTNVSQVAPQVTQVINNSPVMSQNSETSPVLTQEFGDASLEDLQDIIDSELLDAQIDLNADPNINYDFLNFV